MRSARRTQIIHLRNRIPEKLLHTQEDARVMSREAKYGYGPVTDFRGGKKNKTNRNQKDTGEKNKK